MFGALTKQLGKLLSPNRAVDQFCDVAGFEKGAPVYYAFDGSDCTLVEIQGVRTILGPDEFEEALGNGLYNALVGLLREPGHAISLSYESSANVEGDLGALLARQRQNAIAKRLGIDAIIDESEEVLRKAAKRERILMAIWTHPEAGLPDAVSAQRKENAAKWADMPPASNVQSPFLGLDALDAPHHGAVSRILTALEQSGLAGAVLGEDENGRRRDLAELRRSLLFHETDEHWSPFGPEDRRYPGAKERIDDDTSQFFSPPVAQQILSSTALASSTLRTVAMGSREYAVMAFSLFPKRIEHFNKLLAALLPVDRETLPFRVTLHFEHMDGKDFGLRQVLATLASYTSPVSKNLKLALETLQQLHASQQDVLVKVRLVATTWREPSEPPETLERRRSMLMRNLTTWGDAAVMEAPENPMRALAETAAGMTMRSVIPPATIAPLGHLAAMLPLDRPSQIFRSGETIFLSPEGKIMPHEALSPDQLYWLTLMYATPGSGKSVTLNRMNLEFVAYSGGRRLPFVCVIDVGVSSSGFIHLIRNALPENQRHEALYVRLQNSRQHAVNLLEIGPGRREPLARERTFIELFLTTLLGIEHQLVQSLVTRLVTQVYRDKSDLQLSKGANTWQEHTDPALDEEARAIGLRLVETKTTWWSIVDGFMLAGNPRMAMRAQRYASPLLTDLASILADESIQRDFPRDLIQLAQRSLEAAIDAFPIFAHPTNLDIGDARVLSIDLQDIVTRTRSAEAERANSLFFMAARSCFVAKISGHEDEIPAMVLPSGIDERGQALRDAYVRYWRARFADIGEAKKRLAMDEYSLTGSTPGIRQVNLADAREGRKWGLELILVSQLLADFEGMEGIASTVMILNPETAEAREQAMKIFGGSPAVQEVLEKHVRGPVTGRGANMLVRYSLKERQQWALITNLMGPRLLWALTTRKEDRLIREELVKRVSFSEALRILAKRFPQATALPTWDRFVAGGVAMHVDIPTAIVDQIMGEMLQASPQSGGRVAAE